MMWELKNWVGLPRAPILIPLSTLECTGMLTVSDNIMPKICSQPAKDFQEEWKSFPVATYQNLLESLHRRITEVKAAKDG